MIDNRKDKTDETKDLVVRVTSSYYNSKNSLFSKKEIRPLKLKSGVIAVDCFVESSRELPEETFTSIQNLNECDDGLYTMKMVNICRDWETGYIEEWEYKLIPFTE